MRQIKASGKRWRRRNLCVGDEARKCLSWRMTIWSPTRRTKKRSTGPRERQNNVNYIAISLCYTRTHRTCFAINNCSQCKRTKSTAATHTHIYPSLRTHTPPLPCCSHASQSKWFRGFLRRECCRRGSRRHHRHHPLILCPFTNLFQLNCQRGVAKTHTHTHSQQFSSANQQEKWKENELFMPTAMTSFSRWRGRAHFLLLFSALLLL